MRLEWVAAFVGIRIQRNVDGLKELLLKVAATTYFLGFLAAVEAALMKLSY